MIKEQEPPVGSLFLFFLGIFPKKCIIELCGGGGTADTHASGACALSGVRVQIPFSASWKGGPARYGTGLEIRQVDFYSRAGSNPVLSFYNRKDMSYEAHVFSVILFLLLEGHLLGGRSLLS